MFIQGGGMNHSQLGGLLLFVSQDKWKSLWKSTAAVVGNLRPGVDDES